MRFSHSLLIAFALLASPAAHAQAISVEALPELDAWAVGGLSGREPALPRTLWSGAEPAGLGAAFDRLPAQFQSYAAASLARRALLSAGSAPGADAAEAARKRYEAIARIGFAKPLAAMTAGGVAGRDPAIQQFGVQALLALGRLEEACGRVRSIESQPAPAFVLRVRATCFAIGGDWPAAELAIEVARRNRADDPWLFTVLPFLIEGARGARPQGRFDTSLNAAVSVALGLQPPAGALSQASSLATVAVALGERSPASLKPPAAARALSQAILTPEETRAAIVASLPARPPARGQAPPRLGPLTQGVQTAESAAEPAAKLQAVANVLAGARAPAQFAYSARVFAPEIKALPPGALPAAALPMARAALVIGDVERARAWLVVAPPGAPAAAVSALERAEAFARAAGAAAEAAPFIGAATGGLSEEVRAAIVAAQRRGAVGETAILVAAALAPGVETLPEGDLVLALSALEAVGLEADASALALEGLIARAGG